MAIDPGQGTHQKSSAELKADDLHVRLQKMQTIVEGQEKIIQELTNRFRAIENTLFKMNSGLPRYQNNVSPETYEIIRRLDAITLTLYQQAVGRVRNPDGLYDTPNQQGRSFNRASDPTQDFTNPYSTYERGGL